MVRAVVNKKINTPWFVRVLKDIKMSQRTYAAQVGENSGSINRMFRGRRHFGLEDIEKFSQITGASLDDVIKNASGIDPDKIQCKKERTVKVVGWIDKGRGLHFGRVKEARTATAPPGATDGTLAFIYRTPHEPTDGAFIYCRPLEDVGVEMVDRWCVVRLRSGETMLRVLRRSSRQYRFDLLLEGGEVDQAGVLIEAAAKVDWVRY